MAGSPVLGIDLGTTNSVVAVTTDGKVNVLGDEEGNRLFPSVVSFHPSGDVLAGYAARERRLLDAANTIYSVKRLIGRPFKSEEVRRAMDRLPFGFEEGPTGGALVVARGDTYTLPEISAFVLREVRALAEESLNVACRRAVITVPANFNELQRSATKAAGRVAGLDVLRILNEPTAAALAYGCGKSGAGRERVAVYDLGGGTFDITILELAGDVFEVVATAGDTFLGGDDIDVLVADEMAQTFLAAHRYDARHDPQAYERLRAAAEWAKCQLSISPDVELTVEELAYGEGGVGLDLQFTMSRERLEALTQPLVGRTFDVCEEAMRVAGARPTQLDQVILVGGATRIPLVRRMVHEYFGKEPLSNIDPDLVVAQGAAIQGAALAGAPEKKATSAPQMAIGKVALKRVAAPAAAAAKGGVIAKEEQAPAGPAFQPKKDPPPAPPPVQRAPAPTRVGLGVSEMDVSAMGQNLISEPPMDAGDAPLLELDLPDNTPGSLPSLAEQVASRPPPLPVGGGAPALEAPSLEAPSQTENMPSFSPPPLTVGDEGAPLLLDVTPQSLRIETVNGFSEVIIERNAAIPVEQSRKFTTSSDFQDGVKARVCQGESRRLDENQELGEVELTGLRAAKRGTVMINVKFIMDADGTLAVSATEEATGKEQTIRINLIGGVEDEEIERMRQRHEQLVDA